MHRGPGQVKMSGVFIRPQSTIPTAPPIASPLSQRDRDSWLEAASQRNPPRMPDITKLRTWLMRRNTRKYFKLEQLIRWAEREYFKEFGIYPEDARWLLP